MPSRTGASRRPGCAAFPCPYVCASSIISAASARWRARRRLALFVPVDFHLREALPLLGQLLEGEDGLDRADGNAGAAVDACLGVDVELRLGLELGLVLL